MIHHNFSKNVHLKFKVRRQVREKGVAALPVFTQIESREENDLDEKSCAFIYENEKWMAKKNPN
jgi:hypothetical protein